MSAINVTVGQQLSPVDMRLTRSDLVRYAGASTDFNPIHFSDRFARSIGLDGVVAHGMLTMGAALRVVTDWLGDPGRVLSYGVRFTRPVSVPDTDDGVLISFTGTVTSITAEVATVALEARVDGSTVLGAAKVEVSVD